MKCMLLSLWFTVFVFVPPPFFWGGGRMHAALSPEWLGPSTIGPTDPCLWGHCLSQYLLSLWTCTVSSFHLEQGWLTYDTHAQGGTWIDILGKHIHCCPNFFPHQPCYTMKKIVCVWRHRHYMRLSVPPDDAVSEQFFYTNHKQSEVTVCLNRLPSSAFNCFVLSLSLCNSFYKTIGLI